MPDNTNNDAKEEVQPADEIIYVHRNSSPYLYCIYRLPSAAQFWGHTNRLSIPQNASDVKYFIQYPSDNILLQIL